MDWKCIDCGHDESRFDEDIGERECTNCGLIDIEHISSSIEFNNIGTQRGMETDLGNQETPRLKTQRSRFVNKSHTHKERSFYTVRNYARMLLGTLDHGTPFLLKQVDELCKKLYNEYRFTSNERYEMRATAIVYFVLMENNVNVSLRKIGDEYQVNKTQTSRLTRKIATWLGKPHVISNDKSIAKIRSITPKIPVGQDYTRKCLQVYGYLETLHSELGVTPSRHLGAAVAYLTALLEGYPVTQNTIEQFFEVSPRTIWRAMEQIRNITNVKNNQEFKLLMVNNFIQGIRMEEEK